MYHSHHKDLEWPGKSPNKCVGVFGVEAIGTENRHSK